ncbi:TPA: hypothetical protein U3Z39_000632 [Klebsiella pneumoniae]|uniref:hypothetical protein n=1 Tax=Klebsiella pneumoniae TaxID=573 RepID=UPI0010829F28|nr:hypothetical protein [Klebsiella pneumoniae]HCB0591471.1 hypothetical protein [Klebsiella pneumoniae]HEN1634791.1 hypothetical protein [Klebsiella pneumoniae]
MSVIKTFDDWYEKLPSEDKNKILEHIINKKCQITCEGFHAGPHGILQKGLFVAPSGNSAQNKCPVCGK